MPKPDNPGQGNSGNNQGKSKFKVTIGDPMSFSLRPGQTHQLSVTVKNKSGIDITSQCTFSWFSSNNSVATVNSTGLVTAASTIGTSNITVRATHSGVSATSAAVVCTNLGVIIIPPIPPIDPPPSETGDKESTLPRTFIDTRRSSTPSLGATILVNDGDDLQAKYDAASAGDILELASGFIFPSNFVLNVKSGADLGHWITIRKSGTLPPEGTTVRAPVGFPTIRSLNVSNTLSTNGAAAFVRFIGIKFDIDPSVTVSNGCVKLGDGSSAQTDLSQQAHHIILDGCYLTCDDNTDCRKGLNFDGAYLAAVDCDISNFKSLFDAQAITGTNGAGPFKIYHNYLESSGENIAWGGADPHIPNLVPSDIDVRYNLMTKRLSWLGSKWNVKNHYESKNSQYSWLRGNIFENSWVSGQNGLSLSFWSVNQDGSAPWSITAHQRIEYNLIRNVVYPIAVGSNPPASYQIGQPPHHYTFKHNLCLNVNNSPFNSGVARGITIGKVAQLVYRHNTLIHNDTTIDVGVQEQFTDLIFENNIFSGFYQLFSGFGQNSVLWNIIAGPGSKFVSNVFANMLFNQITGNMYPLDVNAIGFVGGASAPYGTSISAMKLASDSPYKNQANDGTDPGVDIDTLNAELALTATA